MSKSDSIDFLRHQGIKIDAEGPDQQKVNCPKCRDKRSNHHDTSLSVNIVNGVFNCHYCSWHGGTGNVKQFEAPIEWKPIGIQGEKIDNEIVKYFEQRGIESTLLTDAVNDLGVRWKVIGGKKKIVFNFLFDGKCFHAKYRVPTDVKEHRDITSYKHEETAPSLPYMLDKIIDYDYVVITEGEIDAISVYAAGIDSVCSIPNGAVNATDQTTGGKLRFLDHIAEYLKDKKRIVLALDNDAAGIRTRDEIARRVGKLRCYVPEYPDGCKDANDVLVKYGADKLFDVIKNSKPFPIGGILDVNTLADSHHATYQIGYPDGAKTHIESLDELFQWHTRQLSVVTGVPSHGKSVWVDNVAMALAIHHGWRVGFFSPEHSVDLHQHRHFQIHAGKPFDPRYGDAQMDQRDLAKAMAFVQEHFRYIDPTDSDFTLDAILEKAEYLACVFGIKLFVIDPWNYIEHQQDRNESETIYTGKVLTKLSMFARNNDVHVMLVAHPKKVMKMSDGINYHSVGPYDISGSANFFNKADNCFAVRREFQEDLSSITQVYVQKVKHSYYGKLGKALLTFDIMSSRYTSMGEVVSMPHPIDFSTRDYSDVDTSDFEMEE